MRTVEPVDDPARRLDFIQALRGIAAMVVVLFHGRGSITGPAYLDLGDRLFGCGAAGVDLFFVISGFIMVHATWKLDGSQRSVAQFLVKRLTRIWPVYVIATFAFLVATFALRSYLTTGAGALALGKAFIFYPLQRHGAPFFGNTPNTVGWTLTYEVWFYVLFGICLRAGRWRWWALTALIAAFAIAVPYLETGEVSLHADHDYGMKPAVLDLLASPLMWEFLGGVGIGVLYKSRFRIGNRPLLAVLTSLAVLFVIWQFVSGYYPYQGPRGWGTGLMVMVLMLALTNKHTPIVVPRWLSWLGDISFSLYLVHRIPQLSLPLLLTDTQFAPFLDGAGFFIGTTTLALVLAYLSWRFVERDLAERCRDWLLGVVDRVFPPRESHDR